MEDRPEAEKPRGARPAEELTDALEQTQESRIHRVAVSQTCHGAPSQISHMALGGREDGEAEGGMRSSSIVS